MDMAMRFVDIRKRVYTFPKMGEKAYFIAIPTSAGTGSEVTPFAVITDESTGVKYPLADYELMPNMAIVDADMHMTAPKGLTAASGIDAVTPVSYTHLNCGFSHRMYRGEAVADNAVKFTIFSPDGEGGYPGNLEMSVTFTVKNDTLTLKYRAVSDRDTVMNFTNHAYFNLGAKNNLTTVLQIKADAITPVDSLLIPTGELMDVTDTERCV